MAKKNLFVVSFLLLIVFACDACVKRYSSHQDTQPAVQQRASFPASTPQHGVRTKDSWYDDRITGHGVVYFYDSGKPYYEFTNFYELKPEVEIDGFDWPTTEQYYQAGKFIDISVRNLIRTGSDTNWKDHKPDSKSWGAWAFYVANESADIRNKARVRKDWLQVMPDLGMQRNINRMLVALRAKFSQDENLRKMLLDTYPKVLVEDSPRDDFWGAGNPNKKGGGAAQGFGKNLLGRMLMHVRKEFYTKKQVPFDASENGTFNLQYLLNPNNEI